MGGKSRSVVSLTYMYVISKSGKVASKLVVNEHITIGAHRLCRG